jgi:hypothetical protein
MNKATCHVACIPRKLAREHDIFESAASMDIYWVCGRRLLSFQRLVRLFKHMKSNHVRRRVVEDL